MLLRVRRHDIFVYQNTSWGHEPFPISTGAGDRISTSLSHSPKLTDYCSLLKTCSYAFESCKIERILFAPDRKQPSCTEVLHLSYLGLMIESSLLRRS